MQHSAQVKAITKGPKVWSILAGDVWFIYGNNKPSCNKGDQVEFTYEDKGKFKVIDTTTLKVVGNTPVSGGYKDSKEDYWQNKAETDKVIQKVIQYQAARRDAITLVTAGISSGALKLPTKSGEAFDSMVDYVESTTNTLYSKIEQEFYSVEEDSASIGDNEDE